MSQLCLPVKWNQMETWSLLLLRYFSSGIKSPHVSKSNCSVLPRSTSLLLDQVRDLNMNSEIPIKSSMLLCAFLFYSQSRPRELWKGIERHGCICAHVVVILALRDVFQLSQVLFDRSPSFSTRREWVEWTRTGCRCSFLSIINFDVSHFKSIRTHSPPCTTEGHASPSLFDLDITLGFTLKVITF